MNQRSYTTRTTQHAVTLTGITDAIEASLWTSREADGVDLVHVRIVASEDELLPPLTLTWTQPVVEIHAFWQPGSDARKQLNAQWQGAYTAKATSNAPVGCFYNLNGLNRLTFAVSDALNPLAIRAGVHEETATLACSIGLPTTALPAVYEVTLRLDTRDLAYHACLNDVQRWWAGQPGYDPAPVPPAARLPMYSTWYSFHQNVLATDVEHQCRLAHELGCDTLIMDDGWQTDDTGRGYAFCGDWQVTSTKIPDMRAHVRRVHDIGMQYLLWYSVPFVGRESRAWERFKGRLLRFVDRLGAGVLDPRYPDVREYMIATYEQALRAWDVDGFKLDFVDSFDQPAQDTGPDAGRDYESVPAAVDRLLTDVIARLRAIKPAVMIEFRQTYIGPLMRTYGNMFRAADCPNDAISNRIRTLDIRLLCGNTAAHADMLMWHPDEPVESAALQLLNVLFAVPQISVRLDTIPTAHQQMLRFWLGWWRAHRDVLLDGALLPLHPEALYPVVIATTDAQRIVAVYADTAVDPGSYLPDELWIVNGTLKQRMILELGEPLGRRRLEVRDCRGALVRSRELDLAVGLHAIDVPAAGLIRIEHR